MAMTTSAIELLQMGRLHADRMADEDEDPTLREGIKYPGKHDVMLGRGGESTYHCGNIAFRQLVEDHKTKYYTCPRAHKSRVVAEVVQKWRQLDPPGRFLTRTNPAAGDKSPWHDVGDGRALKKASHSLRDSVRCFSLEKKQKNSSSNNSADDNAEISVSGGDNRKRGRPEMIQSSNKNNMDEFHSVHQPKFMVMPTFEERPAKRQRAVCDEREEVEEDCRRENDGGDERRGGDDCTRHVPSTIFCDADKNNNNSNNLFSLSSFFNPPREPQQQQVSPRLPSPCGSADWFNHHDLPVQASHAVPPAHVLVNEVVVSPSPVQDEEDDDDNSLGWFGIGGEHDIASFSNAAPLFNVDLGLHRPVAVFSSRNNNCSSNGRE